VPAHTRSAPLAAQALGRGVRVVDLSADLRLDDPAVYAQWYKVDHPHPELLPRPYGLPNWAAKPDRRGVHRQPRRYATSVLLATVPLARHDLLIPGAP